MWRWMIVIAVVGMGCAETDYHATAQVPEKADIDVTVGFTTILIHKFMLDAYVSNILTLSKGRGAENFPRVNDATGFRTEVGFKMGIARFRRI